MYLCAVASASDLPPRSLALCGHDTAVLPVAAEEERNLDSNFWPTRFADFFALQYPCCSLLPVDIVAELMILDSEAAVLANFEFLGQSDVEMSDDDDLGEGLDIPLEDDCEVKTSKRKTKGIKSDGKCVYEE